MQQELLTKPLAVQGRMFRPCAETTYEQDMYIMSLLKEAGLSKLAEKFDVTKDTMDEVAHELIIGAFASGKLFFLLGATMEEEGKEWSILQAQLNGHFFAKLKNKADKDALRGGIVGILLGFLISGVLASTTSQKSSAHVALTPSVIGSDPLFEVQSDGTTENGTTSSEPLPEETAIGSP